MPAPATARQAALFRPTKNSLQACPEWNERGEPADQISPERMSGHACCRHQAPGTINPPNVRVQDGPQGTSCLHGTADMESRMNCFFVRELPSLFSTGVATARRLHCR